MNPKEEDVKYRHRSRSLDELLEAVEGDGRSGLMQAVARQIGQNRPSFECIQESDSCFQGALTEDDVWDCALDQASCLMDARMAPEVEPPEPPDPPPPPPPEPDEDIRVGTVVLATLLVYLHRHGQRSPDAVGSG